MERLEIIETLKHFPDRLEAALAGIPEGVLRTSPSEGEWSIKQILGHLDYAEEIWYRRLYQVWSLHDPVLMSFNEDAERSAIELAAGASDVRTYVNSIRAKRPRIVNLLALAVDWTRTGQWRGEGRRSLKQLAEVLLAHDAEHLARIAEIKAAAGTGAAR
ncbi:MAG: DinB family protein [Dehalococcoidia bacterium]